MTRRRQPHVRVVTSFTRILGELEDGKVRCLCGKAVKPTSAGRLARHLTPSGDDCTHFASYRDPVRLDEVPEVVLPQPREPAEKPEKPAPRLDVGSACKVCGKWLPGERSLCGRCSVTR